jgi:TonB family protein
VHCPNAWLRFSLVLLLAPIASVSAKPVSPEKAALAAQWADLPAYAHLLEGGLRFKVAPRLISGTPPNLPEDLALQTTAFVQVLVAIDEHGDVAAARVCRSDDARLDALAVATILTWKFTPAEDAIGPVKSLVRLPLQFDGPPPAEQSAISINLGPFAYDARRHEISAPILLTGPGIAEVKAARAQVANAVDDTGADLGPESTLFSFPLPFASRSKRTAAALPLFGVSLRPPAVGATKVRELNGTIELVIPALDPDATVQIDQLPAKLGQPVSSPALAAAGITIIVLDRHGSARALTDPDDASSARAFLINVAGKPTAAGKDPTGINRMNDRDVGLAIYDPHGRLAGLEFQTMYGSALPYNRGGWSQYFVGPGKRFSIYRQNSKLTDDIKLVCWLVTPKSLASYPLHAVNIPLPATSAP